MAAILLKDAPDGRIVTLNENGIPVEFILAAHDYESSLNGVGRTLLVRRKMIEYTQSNAFWAGHGEYYGEHEKCSWLNSTYKQRLDADMQAAAAQTKFYSTTGATHTQADGFEFEVSAISRSVFELSAAELGAPRLQYNTLEGTPLPTIQALYNPTVEGDDHDGKAISQQTRTAMYTAHENPNSIYSHVSILCWYLQQGAYPPQQGSPQYICIRPALTLPDSCYVLDDGSVSTNAAPSIPSSITIPSSIMGGSTITLRWGASTDDEGNLAGYKVEKSTDGGSSWSQIYQGTATTTTDSVAFGTSSVMYRVRAYDTEGEHSGYKASSQVTVVNNRAPGAPSSISVPNSVSGGKNLVISWGASSDADGNLSGYILERSINGGTSWSQVYQGANLTYTDTITKGWASVMYRVRAYDPYAESGYTTSAERTVDNNSHPVITCANANNSNLGTKSSGFSISYSVNDEDSGDNVTVTEKLDGVVKRTFTATKGSNNSFAVTGEYFQKVLNGEHKMVIEATDGKATVKHTLNFTKSVTTAVVTLDTPMPADALISICVITVSGSIPSDAQFTVEVTNNAKDDIPVWEDCTTESKNGRNYMFHNKAAAKGFAFNFRVTAERGASGTGGYITSIQGGFQ